MTKRRIEAQFYEDCRVAQNERNDRIDKAEAARAQAERDIAAALRGYDDAYREAMHRRDEALAALNKATP